MEILKAWLWMESIPSSTPFQHFLFLIFPQVKNREPLHIHIWTNWQEQSKNIQVYVEFNAVRPENIIVLNHVVINDKSLMIN